MVVGWHFYEKATPNWSVFYCILWGYLFILGSLFLVVLCSLLLAIYGALCLNEQFVSLV